jgi:hypothetical protein
MTDQYSGRNHVFGEKEVIFGVFGVSLSHKSCSLAYVTFLFVF